MIVTLVTAPFTELLRDSVTAVATHIELVSHHHVSIAFAATVIHSSTFIQLAMKYGLLGLVLVLLLDLVLGLANFAATGLGLGTPLVQALLVYQGRTLARDEQIVVVLLTVGANEAAQVDTTASTSGSSSRSGAGSGSCPTPTLALEFFKTLFHFDQTRFCIDACLFGLATSVLV